MLAFIPGTQELADVLITIIVSVVGSGWAGAHLYLKRREQNFLMKERQNERRASEVKEIREMNMREEEHNIRVKAMESEAAIRSKLMEQMMGNGRLELTGDGKLKPKP